MGRSDRDRDEFPAQPQPGSSPGPEFPARHGLSTGNEPEDEEQPPARDWRETLSSAADFALLGIAVSVISVFLVTAGAAFATGSVATAHWYRTRSMPPVRDLLRTFVRALPAGVVASVVGALLGTVLVADLLLVARGVVPGGSVFLAVGAFVAAQVAGLAALTLVSVGERGGTGWRASVRWAVRAAGARPLAPTGLAAVLALTAAIGLFIPVISPVMLGFALFATHVVAHRMVAMDGVAG